MASHGNLPDPSTFRPVSGHAWRKQQGRDRFVEEKMVLDQFFLGFLRHARKGVVLAFERPV